MIRSLIDTQKHLGWLPDCRMSFSKGYTQGGSNADNVLADAYLKGVNQSINVCRSILSRSVSQLGTFRY